MTARGASAAWDGIKGFGRGLFGIEAQAADPPTPAAGQLPAKAPNAAAAPAAKPATASPSATDTSLDAGTQTAPASMPNPAPAPTPDAFAGKQIMPGVYQHGRGQYSDNPAGMGFAPAKEATAGLSAAVPMADRMAAIQRETQLLRDIGQLRQQAMDANSGMPGGGRAFVLGSSPSSLFSRTPEQQMRDAEVQASSIHKPTAARGQAALKRLSDEQMAAARDASQMQRDQMRAENDMALETMRERGAMARNDANNAIRMADIQARGLDAQTARALDARRLGLDEQVKGFDIRAAKRLDDLRNSYLSAKTDAERAKIAKELRDLSGKGDGSLKDNFMVVGGGQEWDAQAGVMRNVPQRLIDLRTGQEVGTGGQGAQQQKFEVGKVYVDANGNRRRWDGKAWQPV